MPASPFVKEVDGIQRALKPLLKEHGYRMRGRTFNRVTPDGLTQVINLQMGPSDPPGTTYIPGLRDNLHGLFTINLGVYVPEVSDLQGSDRAKTWIQDYHCSIRSRLSHASGSEQDFWWHAKNEVNVVADIQSNLLSYGLIFLERFDSRDKILEELDGHEENLEYCLVPRIVSAIILSKRGATEAAKILMAAQAKESRRNPNHPAYVRQLALRMGIGEV